MALVEPRCPEAAALRLVGLRPGRRSPGPPLGMRAWSDSTDVAVAVLLELSGDGEDDVTALVAQIPEPDTLRDGTLVVVLQDAARDEGIVARLFRGARVSRAARCSALLSRGYVSIEAATDPRSGQDLVWGYA